MIPRHARKILVVRLSARGDVVFASPLAGALRRRYPQAHIAWVCEERTADVIENNPHLDQVIVWQRASWKRLAKGWRWGRLTAEVRSFVNALRAPRFDVAIDAQGLLRSGAVAFLSGAPVRIGLDSREGSGALMTRVVKRRDDPRGIGSEYRYLAGELGLETDPFPMEIPRTDSELAAVDAALAAHGVAAGFVVVCPFTTRFYKHWLEDRWSTLIRRIREEAGEPVVVLGGPDDRAAADRVVGAAGTSGAPVVDLVGRTSLGEASAVVARCRALVGVDTGLSHMAHAFGRPAVLIFGSNTPYLDPPTPVATILHSGRPCSPCRGKLTCDGRVDCMRDVGVDQVFDAVVAHLANRGPAGVLDRR